MGGVGPLPTAVLLHLDPLTVVLPVLGGYVVAALAALASEGHLYTLLVLCHFSLHLDMRCRRSTPPARLVAAVGLEPTTPRL